MAGGGGGRRSCLGRGRGRSRGVVHGCHVGVGGLLHGGDELLDVRDVLQTLDIGQSRDVDTDVGVRDDDLNGVGDRCEDGGAHDDRGSGRETTRGGLGEATVLSHECFSRSSLCLPG